jgi:hypothetical protein
MYTEPETKKSGLAKLTDQLHRELLGTDPEKYVIDWIKINNVFRVVDNDGKTGFSLNGKFVIFKWSAPLELDTLSQAIR